MRRARRLIDGAIGVLLLGMGMPTLPAYLITILVVGPAIEAMGLTALTAHLFVFYYGVASSITRRTKTRTKISKHDADIAHRWANQP